MLLYHKYVFLLLFHLLSYLVTVKIDESENNYGKLLS